MKQNKIIEKIYRYLSLSFGILFLLIGFLGIFSNFLSGIFTLLMGFTLLPVTNNFLQDKFSLKLSPLKKTLILFILILGIVIFSSEEVKNNTQEPTQSDTPVIEENTLPTPSEGENLQSSEEEKIVELDGKEEIISENIVSYVIAEKKDYSRKVLTEKSFSEYSVQEIENAPMDKKFSYKVVLEGTETLKQIKDVARKIIQDTIRGDEDMDELSLLFYSEEGLVSGGYDIGSATWAVNGKLGDITADQAKNNIRTNHKIVFEIKDDIEKYLKERKITEDKFGLSTEKRKEIFKAIVAAEDKGRDEAEKIFPTNYDAPNYSIDNLMLNIDKERELADIYKAGVNSQYGITQEISGKIVGEGLTYNWPLG